MKSRRTRKGSLRRKNRTRRHRGGGGGGVFNGRRF